MTGRCSRVFAALTCHRGPLPRNGLHPPGALPELPPALETLELSSCHELRTLPLLPKALAQLAVRDCPMLKCPAKLPPSLAREWHPRKPAPPMASRQMGGTRLTALAGLRFSPKIEPSRAAPPLP